MATNEIYTHTDGRRFRRTGIIRYWLKDEWYNDASQNDQEKGIIYPELADSDSQHTDSEILELLPPITPQS